MQFLFDIDQTDHIKTKVIQSIEGSSVDRKNDHVCRKEQTMSPVEESKPWACMYILQTPHYP